ncbi:carbohydrate ABC transporter permease [uncultured Amnibacterium sp.]|uniref:carbohydrate ABC transporter permease n=1 Tax=uncultured Amnibacterium sp. TaxID=1631851 RepID=UPI0035CBCB36
MTSALERDEAVATRVTRRTPTHSGRGARIGRLVGTIAMVLCAALTAVPLLLLAANALKTNAQIVSNPIAPPVVPQLGNFSDAWQGGAFGDPLSVSFANSVIVTVLTTIVVTVLAALAGYALGTIRFRGEGLVTQTVLVLLAIPVQATLIPIFDQLGNWGLRNTYLGIVLVYVAFWMPFSILLMRAAFRGFPVELLEAARVDGAGEARVLRAVVLPILKGPIAGVAIVNAIGIWSELLFSYVLLTDPSMRTLPAAVIAFQGVFTTDYRLLYAGLLISVLPVLIFYGALSRLIRKGVSAGSFR